MDTRRSRSSPGPRYEELIGYYRAMHRCGVPASGLRAEETFDGRTLYGHAEVIGKLLRSFGGRTVLDYGSGKGRQYARLPVDIEMPDGRRFEDIPSFWGATVTCYDPGCETLATLPPGPFDAVICTDMLEHCDQEDLPWILTEMFASAGKLVYASVALYPAQKTLPNGENAHVTLRPADWWQRLFESVAHQYPAVHWLVAADSRRMMHQLGINHPDQPDRFFFGNISRPRLGAFRPQTVPRAAMPKNT